MISERNLAGASASPASLPIYREFPGLGAIPRAVLCTFPSPVMKLDLGGTELWIKRDDLNADVCGGNKARSLEFLLGAVQPGDTVLTIGGAGSTHVLSTALHASRLGARTIAMRWRHDMNPSAELVSRRIGSVCSSRISLAAPIAMMRALLHRARHRVHYVPLGGSVPLGVLAQVNAGLELAQQVNDGALPRPCRVVLPLGSGGSTAGLALGLAIAGMEVQVVGARVAPRLAANKLRVMRLVARTRALIERTTGQDVPPVRSDMVHVVHDVFGGAYGKALPRAESLARQLQANHGIRLDSTYSAKAFAAAARLARDSATPTLFWLTFDARCLDAGP